MTEVDERELRRQQRRDRSSRGTQSAPDEDATKPEAVPDIAKLSIPTEDEVEKRRRERRERMQQTATSEDQGEDDLERRRRERRERSLLSPRNREPTEDEKTDPAEEESEFDRRRRQRSERSLLSPRGEGQEETGKEAEDENEKRRRERREERKKKEEEEAKQQREEEEIRRREEELKRQSDAESLQQEAEEAERKRLKEEQEEKRRLEAEAEVKRQEEDFERKRRERRERGKGKVEEAPQLASETATSKQPEETLHVPQLDLSEKKTVVVENAVCSTGIASTLSPRAAPVLSPRPISPRPTISPRAALSPRVAVSEHREPTLPEEPINPDESEFDRRRRQRSERSLLSPRGEGKDGEEEKPKENETEFERRKRERREERRKKEAEEAEAKKREEDELRRREDEQRLQDEAAERMRAEELARLEAEQEKEKERARKAEQEESERKRLEAEKEEEAKLQQRREQEAQIAKNSTSSASLVATPLNATNNIPLTIPHSTSSPMLVKPTSLTALSRPFGKAPQACGKFVAHAFKPNTCNDCFLPKSEHGQPGQQASQSTSAGGSSASLTVSRGPNTSTSSQSTPAPSPLTQSPLVPVQTNHQHPGLVDANEKARAEEAERERLAALEAEREKERLRLAELERVKLQQALEEEKRRQDREAERRAAAEREEQENEERQRREEERMRFEAALRRSQEEEEAAEFERRVQEEMMSAEQQHEPEVEPQHDHVGGDEHELARTSASTAEATSTADRVEMHNTPQSDDVPKTVSGLSMSPLRLSSAKRQQRADHERPLDSESREEQQHEPINNNDDRFPSLPGESAALTTANFPSALPANLLSNISAETASETEDSEKQKAPSSVPLFHSMTFRFRLLRGDGRLFGEPDETEAPQLTLQDLHLEALSNGQRVPITDHKDGSYSFTHKVIGGDNVVEVKQNGHPFPGFPTLKFTKRIPVPKATSQTALSSCNSSTITYYKSSKPEIPEKAPVTGLETASSKAKLLISTFDKKPEKPRVISVGENQPSATTETKPDQNQPVRKSNLAQMWESKAKLERKNSGPLGL